MSADAQAVAERIYAEWMAGKRFATLRAAELARGLPFAYAVQKALIDTIVRHDRFAISGYKLGLTSAVMQQKFGMAEPAYGFLFDRAPGNSPVTLSSGDYQHLMLEGEIALRIGSVPTPAQLAGPLVDLIHTIDQIAAAIEIVDDRHARYAKVDGCSLIADNIWNRGFVLGPPCDAHQIIDIADLAGTLWCGDERVSSGSSADVLGSPLNGLAWLAHKLAADGLPLKPGQWILTGSFTGIRATRPGEAYRLTVEGLDPVALHITD